MNKINQNAVWKFIKFKTTESDINFNVKFPTYKNVKINSVINKYSVVALNEKQARKKLALQLGLGKCPNYLKKI
jgi:predicted transcriptional regulator